MNARMSAGLVSCALVATVCGSTAAAYPLFNFFEVTQIAQDAVRGINVPEPVPGFELVLFKDGRRVYKRSFGAWSSDRVANADSATKTLSGAVIMALTDDSPTPFSLNTKLSDYNPAFVTSKRNIAIRQCFSHTAGFDTDSTAVSNPFITLQQAALQIASEPLVYPAGTTFSYGGVGMHAAGAIAETVAGQSWDSLYEQRIAGPLNFQVTRYVLSSPTNPRIAGGAESNAEEFARFMEMLRNDGVHNGRRVLSHQAVQQLFTRQTPLGIPVANSPFRGSADYGVGVWLDQRLADGTLVGARAAGARGFSAWVDFDDGMVGAFSTDLSSGQNVVDLVDAIRDAAQRSVRSPRPCAADFNADAFLDFRDFDDFVQAFELGDPSSDYNEDGFLTFEDFDAFVQAFYAGC
ncbi:MAG: serine hydrolase [Planctomycetota bacterium]|nr:serine hydrolase [Planctomycetota bacterium]